MSDPTIGNISVTVWNEGRHEKTDPQVAVANFRNVQDTPHTAKPLEPVAIKG